MYSVSLTPAAWQWRDSLKGELDALGLRLPTMVSEIFG